MSRLEELQQQIEEEREKVKEKEVFIETYTKLLKDYQDRLPTGEVAVVTGKVLSEVEKELTLFVENKIEEVVTGVKTEQTTTESLTDEEILFLKKLAERGLKVNLETAKRTQPIKSNPQQDLFRQQHANKVNTDITFIENNQQYTGHVIGITNNQLIVRVGDSPAPMKVNPIQIQEAY